MMDLLPPVALRRTARLGLAGAMLVVAVTGASADDGIGGLLNSIFGGQPQQSAPAPDVSADPAPHLAPVLRQVRRIRDRPLTVRLHAAKPRLVVAQAPTKPGRVSIYEDRTLRRGDAVMTADGVRIFAGSSSWPYVARDFVQLKDSKSIDRDTWNVLAQLDRAPRG
jgi:hypothetical protein